MKKLNFRYEMQLAFDQVVWDHHFLIRCRPMENGRQHGECLQVTIEPADTINEVQDGFGNSGYAVSVRDQHDRLYVKAEGTVYVDLSGETEPFHPMYGFPSAYTMPDKGIRRFLQDTMKELGAVWESGRKAGSLAIDEYKELEYMMDRLYRRFVYVPGATTVKTTAAEALALGQGVCQDYAHVFISLCRLAGVPARYAAGMMLGEGASHAWVEVWVNGMWVGIDPTNNRLTDETYIKLTHGRDFGDGAIDRGRFLGFAGQTQSILVKVKELL